MAGSLLTDEKVYPLCSGYISIPWFNGLIKLIFYTLSKFGTIYYFNTTFFNGVISWTSSFKLIT